MDMVSQVKFKVNEVFHEKNIERIAREVGFIKRARKIKPKQLLEKIISLNLQSPGSSLEDLALAMYKENIFISKQALHKKFNQNTVCFFQKILGELLQNALSEHQQHIAAFPFIKRIQVADSSEIKFNKILSNQFPQVRNQGAAIKLQAIIDAINNQVLSLDVRPSKEPDQSYKDYFLHIQAGDLMIADLGYFCLDSFYKIQLKNGFFLSRYYKQTHVYDEKTGEKIDLRAKLKKAKTNKIKLSISLGADKLPCRLVALRLPKKAYQKRLKHLEDKRRRDPDLQRSDDIFNRWTIFVTNLPKSVGPDSLRRLYSIRWQIELLFKIMKTSLHLRKIDSTNQYRTLVSVYTSLITMTLLSFIVTTIVDKEISLYKASKIFAQNITTFFLLLSRKICSIAWFKKILCKFALKESREKRLSTKHSLEILCYA